MDELIKIMNVFANKYVIRIYKLLNKKMLTLKQIVEIIELDKETAIEYLDKLIDIQVIKKMGKGDDTLYYAIASSSLFNKHARDITNIINRSFNQNNEIINDFHKINKIKK